ncbi:MAG: hypothetical protein ACP5QO_12450 [Clostridia bacterium]
MPDTQGAPGTDQDGAISEQQVRRIVRAMVRERSADSKGTSGSDSASGQAPSPGVDGNGQGFVDVVRQELHRLGLAGSNSSEGAGRQGGSRQQNPSQRRPQQSRRGAGGSGQDGSGLSRSQVQSLVREELGRRGTQSDAGGAAPSGSASGSSHGTETADTGGGMTAAQIQTAVQKTRKKMRANTGPGSAGRSGSGAGASNSGGQALSASETQALVRQELQKIQGQAGPAGQGGNGSAGRNRPSGQTGGGGSRGSSATAQNESVDVQQLQAIVRQELEESQSQGGAAPGGGSGPGSRQTGDTTVANALTNAQWQLSQELEANLKQLRQVINQSQEVARKIEQVLGYGTGSQSSS